MSQNYYWFSDDLVLPASTDDALSQVLQLQQEGQFSESRVLKLGAEVDAKSIRGDKVWWVDDWTLPWLENYRSIIEEFCLLAKRYLFLPSNYYDGHVAHYPPGTGYKTHVDSSPSQSRRLLTVVFYLSDLRSNDGGELVLYDDAAKPIIINPYKNRVVIFDSTMEHMVRNTSKDRYSLAVWICRSDRLLS